MAAAGAEGLVEIGLPRRRAEVLLAFARAVAGGALCLDPGGDAAATQCALWAIEGFDERLANARGRQEGARRG